MDQLTFNTNFPLLIDLEHVNGDYEWYSTDDENAYRFNRKKMGHTWRYATEKINYKFNSLGYRTKEISDLDKNFMLAFGCSFTEGVGISEDDIWTRHVAEYCGLDLFNASKQASSSLVPFQNSIMWKANKLPIPKLVVCQWPQKTRRLFGDTHNQFFITLNDRSETKTLDGKWWGRRYLDDVGDMNLTVQGHYEGLNAVWQALGVPVLNFCWEQNWLEVPLYTKMHHIHSAVGSFGARDCGHDGPEFHLSTAEQLNDILSSYEI